MARGRQWGLSGTGRRADHDGELRAAVILAAIRWSVREVIQMYTIRRFAVMKTATVVAVMYMVIVAIFIIPFALLTVAVGRGDSAATGMVGILVFGLLAALLYGVVGWIITAIACAIYNLVAGWVGGIEVQVDQVMPPPVAQLWAPSAPIDAPPPPSGPSAS